MFNIVGIDPSTNSVGLAVLTINSKTFKIVNIITYVLDISNPFYLNEDNPHIMYKLSDLTHLINNYISMYEPLAVGIESPFMDRNKPGSALPLGQSVQAIQFGIYQYSKSIPIGMYPPASVKRTVGAKGGTGKIEILDALKEHRDVTRLINLDNITDHEVDAIAIAKCALKDIIYNPLLLLR